MVWVICIVLSFALCYIIMIKYATNIESVYDELQEMIVVFPLCSICEPLTS